MMQKAIDLPAHLLNDITEDEKRRINFFRG